MKPAVAFLLLLIASAPLGAHVGSPDVFFEGKAGPYPVSVAIRPPMVIPGIAEVEIRTAGPGVREIHVVPYPLTGIASKLPPTPDLAKPSAADPLLYSASVWLMAFGSFQVRVDVDGAEGRGTLAVPIPSFARETKQMQSGLGWILAVLMTFIVAGAISIAGAATRESTLPAAEVPDALHRRRSRIAMAAATAALLGTLVLGNQWWGAEASTYREHIYKPSAMHAAIEGDILKLAIATPAAIPRRQLGGYLPDHGHLMHLFLVRTPQMDRMWHLHPDPDGDGEFRGPAPSLPAGHYRLFADVVHATGFPETPVTELTVDRPVAGRALSGDDAEGSAPPMAKFDPQRQTFPLQGGHRVVRLTPPAPLAPRQMQHLRFEVEDAAGHAVSGLQPYMGMSAHAEFINEDATVFAHVHPSGTVPMAALGLTAGSLTDAAMAHHGHQMIAFPAQITFPYGFPKAGRYRMFIQLRREQEPETAAFDFEVGPLK